MGNGNETVRGSVGDGLPAGRLAGKVAIITGGARGQGAAEAAAFAREGARVVLTDVLTDEGADTAASVTEHARFGGGARFLRHDVASETDWRGVVADVLSNEARIDVLVNNAGVFRPGGATNTSEADYRFVIDINQIGVFLGMRAVIPTMTDQRSGSIINISSIAGLQAAAGFVAYSASKWAVRGMTRSVAREVAPIGIRVNSVHPGIIDTPMADLFDSLGIRSAVDERIPLGREATPEDVASLVLYLASDESRYSTGSEFVVDGGWTA
jgi:3alpha(or 20beta)-hydroxysteroid dehydrogenase